MSKRTRHGARRRKTKAVLEAVHSAQGMTWARRHDTCNWQHTGNRARSYEVRSWLQKVDSSLGGLLGMVQGVEGQERRRGRVWRVAPKGLSGTGAGQCARHQKA